MLQHSHLQLLLVLSKLNDIGVIYLFIPNFYYFWEL
jgi:hypothetical protein